jgi:ABC-type bacteriocin/lantibiotic exporter with double-glycine peptidase domain
MKIDKFPELRQTYYWDCGAKAIQAILAYYGIDVHEETIIKLAGTTETGTPIKGLKKVIKKYGLKFDGGRMTIEDIKKYIDKKIPVILLLQAWPMKKITDWENYWDDGHYAVAIRYDKKKIYFEDPWTFFRTYLSYDELQKRWHDRVGGKEYYNYGLAVYGKKISYNLRKIIHMD